jgi:hypothetical protein
MEAWILIIIVFSLLWLFWRMLNFTFDLIEKAHAELRRVEDAEATEGKGS